MENLVVRPAVIQDREAVVKVKTAFLRQLCQGYSSLEELKQLDPTPFHEGFTSSVAHRKVFVFEKKGQIVAFIVFGVDKSDSEYGLIDDMGILPEENNEELRERMFADALQALYAEEIKGVHIWILHDNFRTRYFLEQAGFRSEGIRHPLSYVGRESTAIRYLHRAKKVTE